MYGLISCILVYLLNWYGCIAIIILTLNQLSKLSWILEKQKKVKGLKRNQRGYFLLVLSYMLQCKGGTIEDKIDELVLEKL
jgi:hypothetical protein